MRRRAYRARLARLPAPGSGAGYHTGCVGVANVGRMCGLGEGEVVADLEAAAEAGDRAVPQQEIVAAVAHAYATSYLPLADEEEGWARERRRSYARRKQLAESQAKIARATGQAQLQRLIEAGRLGTPSQLERWIGEASSIHPSSYSTAAVLSALYKPDDWLFVGQRRDVARRGESLQRVRDWIRRPGTLRGPFLGLNPLSGRSAPKRAGGTSYRCDAAVSRRRYALAEWDMLSRDDQLALWLALPLPIVALVDSGGKSLHGWIPVADEAQAQRVYEYLAPLGVDLSCRNPSRLARLPGVQRPDTEPELAREQRLLFLAEGNGRILREVHASRCGWRPPHKAAGV